MITSLSIDGVKSKKTTERDWKPVLLRILSLFFAGIVCIELIFYFIFLPLFSNLSISIYGISSIEAEDLISEMGFTSNDRWINFNAAELSQSLSLIPSFESVIVEKKYPDKIIVSVIPREAVAVSFGILNNRTVAYEIDRFGVICKVGNTKINQNLPIITGLNIENPTEGMRIDYQYLSLLENLKVLKKNNQDVLSLISEIKIEEKAYGGYDLVIYPVYTSIKVKTDKALNQQGLQYMMLLLDVVGDLNLDIDELDIRSGTVAYKIKGEKA